MKADNKFPWKGKISNTAQLGSIETSVLDNGPGRGGRIAWVNTGSPLRYKIVIDRAMDIADAFYGQHSLAWLSHAGISAPNPAACRGMEWLVSFGGGLLTTCGLTHTGNPESDKDGERGLHGRVSNIPASLESVLQPDPETDVPEMGLTGTIRESRVFGPCLELKRTISSRLGEPAIRIHDVVTNRGNTPAPHMILYHCNFGWPLADAGTQIIWKGKCRSRGLPMDDAIFNGREEDYRKCRGPIKEHEGGGSACGFIDVIPDSKGVCTVGLDNKKLGLSVAVKYRKDQLPWFTNWQHWGNGEYVTGLEPGTNPPIGRIEAGRTGRLIQIAPGESRAYDLEISVKGS